MQGLTTKNFLIFKMAAVELCLFSLPQTWTGQTATWNTGVTALIQKPNVYHLHNIRYPDTDIGSAFSNQGGYHSIHMDLALTIVLWWPAEQYYLLAANSYISFEGADTDTDGPSGSKVDNIQKELPEETALLRFSTPVLQKR